MKLSTALLFAMWLSPAASQDYTSISQAVDHVFQVTTFSYPGFKGYVKLWSTQRIPEAKGKVWIARESAKNDHRRASGRPTTVPIFRAAFNTYVLWLISPEGKLENAGEFVLRRDRSELQTTTTLASFGMFITAEPNCSVEAPSRFVVLVNAPTVNGIWAPGPAAIIHYAPQEVFEKLE
jgi:hypothetical protein